MGMVRSSRIDAAPAIAVLVCASATGCAQLPPVPPAATLAASTAPALPPVPPLVRLGEEMRWKVHVGSFSGGSFALQVSAEPPRRRTDGRAVAVVRGRFATSGIASLFEDRESDDTTWLDLETGTPLRYRSALVDDGKRSLIEARFETGSIELVERKAEGGHRRARQRVPDGAAFNLYAALFALRAWPTSAAASATLSVWARSRLWRITVQRRGIEVVDGPRGRVDAYRIDGIAWRTRRGGGTDPDTQPRRFRIYLSADRDRLPVLLDTATRFGRMRAELVEYRPAAQPSAENAPRRESP